MIAWRAAMEQVFILQNNPDAIYDMRQAPLPEGISTLMRLASSSGDLLNDVSQTLAIEADVLHRYISDYLVAMCFYANAQPERILGLNNAKNIPLAKEHHRLLLKWLHPDKNPDFKIYAEQVNQAWAWLKIQDSQQSKPVTHAVKVPEVTKVPIRTTHHIPIRNSRFPLFLMVLSAIAAVLLLVSYWPDNSVYVSGASVAENVKQENASSPETTQYNQSLSKRYKQPTILPLPPPPNVDVAYEELSLKQMAKPVLKPKQSIAGNEAKRTAEQALSTQQPKELAKLATTQPNTLLELGTTNTVIQVKTESNIKQAGQVLNAFASTYQNGNLEQFMALFTANARNNRGDRSAIEQDYRHLFNESEQRSIQFSDLQWQDDGLVSLRASYDTKVKWQDKFRSSKQTGHIEFIFIEENGRVRIQQVLLAK